MTRPKALLIAGYFDWFSGYQETVLAPALAMHTDLRIIASDRVAPIFGDAHLASLGVSRRYPTGRSEEHGILMFRVPVKEWRGMVWGRGARKLIDSGGYDVIVQVMPGQGLPLAASLAKTSASRVVLYGDNSAMWARLSSASQRLKWHVFAATKGSAYRFANRRAEVSYGYTPETLTRLAPFTDEPMRLLPLAFDEARFFLSRDLRAEGRARRGYSATDRVVVFAGKFDRVKRIDLLLRAFAQARSTDPDLRLLLVGGDQRGHTSDLTDLTDELGIRDVTTVEGFQDAAGLNAAFNTADIGVWPQQPAITIQQAMASGLPAVLPHSQWVSHLITPTSGVYVGPGTGLSGLAEGIGAAFALGLDPEHRASRATENLRFAGRGVARQILVDVGLMPSGS